MYFTALPCNLYCQPSAIQVAATLGLAHLTSLLLAAAHWQGRMVGENSDSRRKQDRILMPLNLLP